MSLRAALGRLLPGVLAVAMGLKATHRVYLTNPPFERGHNKPWEPHPWFSNVERRSIFVALECCMHSFWQYRRRQPVLALPPPVELPEGFLFDWMRDSAPHWEPGSTAFWLEPETHQELANWYAKYRPEVTGFVEAAGLRIEIVPAPVQRIRNYHAEVLHGSQEAIVPHRSNPYANQLNQLQQYNAQQHYKNQYSGLLDYLGRKK